MFSTSQSNPTSKLLISDIIKRPMKKCTNVWIIPLDWTRQIHISIHYQLMIILRSYIKSCSVQIKVVASHIPTANRCHVDRLDRYCCLHWQHNCYRFKSRRTPTKLEWGTWPNSAIWISFIGWKMWFFKNIDWISKIYFW